MTRAFTRFLNALLGLRAPLRGSRNDQFLNAARYRPHSFDRRMTP